MTASKMAGRMVAMLLGTLAVHGAGMAKTARKVPAGARYVALGSSFASGPGVTSSADTPPDRCTRSTDNYAHQLARSRKLDLTDVSCGGATTEHVLSGWNELPPQVDALTPDTRLVTITIGGNDVKYVGGLIAASCPRDAALLRGAARRCGSVPPATFAEWSALEARMERVAGEVARRSPKATLVFVGYLELLPARGTCAVTPLSEADAARARDTARQLARVTGRVARRAGAKVLSAKFSRGHDVCAAVPWATGFAASPQSGVRVVPYHPNLAGMTAIARALDRML